MTKVSHSTVQQKDKSSNHSQNADVVCPQLSDEGQDCGQWANIGLPAADPVEESEEDDDRSDGETVAALKKQLMSVINFNSIKPAEPITQPVIDPALAAVLKRFGATRRAGLSVGSVIDEFIAEQVQHAALEESFYIVDLGHVVHRFSTWTKNLPRVHPFYAVKCNPDPALVATLASQGGGFDCASLAEMQLVLSTGVPPELIIFANPCKMASHIAFARDHGVTYMTFDSIPELVKVRSIHPDAKMVLRVRADDRTARCALGVKYGAEHEEVDGLLEAALELGVNVVGVSFHVGSGSCNPEAFAMAIRAARGVFDAATRVGLPPLTLLDIGGGFSGGGRSSGGSNFSMVAAVINLAIDEYFPPSASDTPPVRVIAEPGRFFAESSSHLACNVFGRRVRAGKVGDSGRATHEYWISDGMYGSMNCVMYDHATLFARPLRLATRLDLDKKTSKMVTMLHPAIWPQGPMHLSTVFGPTCDGLDQVLTGFWLPDMEVGDWLVFPDMGAYTMSAGSNFNGFNNSQMLTYYVWIEHGDSLDDMSRSSSSEACCSSDACLTDSASDEVVTKVQRRT
eukprot:jgi/Mesvir1/19578/Mv09881-RA.1